MKRDLTGKVFGQLTVLKPVGKDCTNRNLWLCVCSCGGSFTTRRHNLTMGISTRCKECRLTTSVIRNVFERYEKQARQRNISFELTKSDVCSLIFRDCSYCGRSPENISLGRKLRPYNGIDRLDNSKGYSKTNCTTACKWCNRSKGTRSVSDFHKWIVEVYERSICDRN